MLALRRLIFVCGALHLCSLVKAQKTPLKIVLVGDSLSAGNADRNDDGEVDYEPPYGCYRSRTCWGQRYADTLRDEFEVTVINRACSGARLIHIADEPQLLASFLAGPNACDNANLLPKHPQVFYEQISPLSCGRYIQTQYDITDPSVDLVMGGLGGNDGLFSDAILACFFPPTRSATQCKEALENSIEAIETVMGPRLLDVIRIIREKMTLAGEAEPRGKLVMVDYPFVALDSDFELSDRDTTINPSLETRIAQSKAAELFQEVVDEINSETETDFVFFFNKTKEIFAGHEVDPTLRKNPDAWIEEAVLPRYEESFHPNGIGHTMLAAALAEEGTFGVSGGAALGAKKSPTAEVVAWVGESYGGKVGETIVFDAHGSYDSWGSPILTYEWDMDDDGVIDATTDGPLLSYVYTGSYTGYISVKVTSDNGSSTAKAYVEVKK